MAGSNKEVGMDTECLVAVPPSATAPPFPSCTLRWMVAVPWGWASGARGMPRKGVQRLPRG